MWIISYYLFLVKSVLDATGLTKLQIIIELLPHGLLSRVTNPTDLSIFL
jgi:hypothetical protein